MNCLWSLQSPLRASVTSFLFQAPPLDSDQTHAPLFSEEGTPAIYDLGSYPLNIPSPRLFPFARYIQLQIIPGTDIPTKSCGFSFSTPSTRHQTVGLSTLPRRPDLTCPPPDVTLCAAPTSVRQTPTAFCCSHHLLSASRLALTPSPPNHLEQSESVEHIGTTRELCAGPTGRHSLWWPVSSQVRRYR